MIGKMYEDPEGIWEIVEVNGNEVVVQNVQEGNLNFGKQFSVTAEEAEYYLGERRSDEIKDLAERLDQFYKDFYPYDYADVDGSPEQALKLLREYPFDVIKDLLDIVEEHTKERM